MGPEEEEELLRALLARLEAVAEEAMASSGGAAPRLRSQHVGLPLGEDPFACLAYLQRRQRVPTSLLRSLCEWAQQNARRRDGAHRKSALSARKLVALDDACEARGLFDDTRERLDSAIR